MGLVATGPVDFLLGMMYELILRGGSSAVLAASCRGCNVGLRLQCHAL